MNNINVRTYHKKNLFKLRSLNDEQRLKVFSFEFSILFFISGKISLLFNCCTQVTHVFQSFIIGFCDRIFEISTHLGFIVLMKSIAHTLWSTLHFEINFFFISLRDYDVTSCEFLENHDFGGKKGSNCLDAVR